MNNITAFLRYSVLTFGLLMAFGCARESHQNDSHIDSAIIEPISDSMDGQIAQVSIEASLAPSTDSTDNSEVLLLKLRNGTDEAIGYGEAFRLYRKEGDDWEKSVCNVCLNTLHLQARPIPTRF